MDAGDPLPPQAVSGLLQHGIDSRRPSRGEAAFKVGERFCTIFHTPLGATRLPRYLRGHVGTVAQVRGWHVLPDANAQGEERAEPLYCDGFRVRDRWDDMTRARDMVFADLWESYLEPA